MLLQFKSFLIRRGIEKSSVALRFNHAKRLFVFCDSEITKTKVEEFLLELYDSSRKQSYINHFIITAKLWGKCFNIPELLTLKTNKVTYDPRAIMSDEEILAFLALPIPVTPHWKALWETWNIFWSLCAYCGLRPSEAGSLTVNNVEFGRSIIRVRGKMGERTVPLPPNLIPMLTEYIKSIQTEALFPGMNRAAWHWQFKERLRRLGIKRKGLVPYSFRHSAATRWIEDDINIFKVKKMLGHKRITTTEIYAHLTTKDIVEAIKKDRLGIINSPKEIRLEKFKKRLMDLRSDIEKDQDSNYLQSHLLDNLLWFKKE